MRKTLSLILATVFVAITISACYTQTHVVGRGAQSGVTETARQWYVLWGLVPINNVDSKGMAGGASDYTITTQDSFLDIIISSFTSVITVACRSVEVKK